MPQRFSILIQRSSSEIKDYQVDLPSESSPKPVNLRGTTKLHGSINELSPSAMPTARKLWRYHPGLVFYGGLCLAMLCIMSVISINWFDARNRTASRWARLMETTGFVDWPQLEDKSSLPALCAATPIVVGMVSAMVVPWSLFTRNATGIKLFVYALVLTVAASMLQSGLASNPTTIDEDAVEALTSQTNAVANFNRGFCQAWCRHSEAGLAAFVRGDCGPKQKTLFDQLSGQFDMKDWCLDAIEKQKFELVAEFNGVSPFAGLKGSAGHALTNLRPAVLSTLSLSCGLFVLIVGMVLVIGEDGPFHMNVYSIRD